LTALVLTAVFRRHTQAVAAVLAGMFFRLGLPLVIGVWLHEQHGPLSEAGVVGMIVAFYFVTLSTETVLAVRLVRATPHQSPGN
jgi:apolipoprotein N-acyltransferase